MLPRLVATGVMALAVLGVGAGPALADGLVLDGSSVEASEEENGYSAEIAVLNTGGRVALPQTDVVVSGSCTVVIKDLNVPTRQDSKVQVTFGKACFKDDDSFKVDLDGPKGMPAVTLKKPAEDHDWRPFWISAGIAAVAGGVVFLLGVAKVSKVNAALQNPTAADQTRNQASYARVQALVAARVSALGTQPLVWVNPLPAPGQYDLESEVKGLEAGWSFKDSWAANLTVATTAFVALVNSADTLKAVLGEEPKAALAVMTVAGLISAAIIAIANTVAKLLGKSVAEVTTRGLILSTSLVVFAAGLQAGTVGGSALTLVDGWQATSIVLLVTIAVGAVLVWYAVMSMRGTLESGAPAPVPSVPPDALEAWDATEDWERSVVDDLIRTKYKDWLTTAPPAPAVLPYPGPWPSPGDEYFPMKASLI